VTLKTVLFDCLRDAGALIRRAFDRPKKVSFKGNPINLLTETDQAADRLIRRQIERAFPDHDLLTEESTPTGKGSAYKWIVDPLDGTTNFAHHFPQVCISMAVEHRGTIILAGVYDPLRDELFWAERGRGAFLRHRKRQTRLQVSKAPALKQSLLITGFPYDRRQHVDYYLSFVKAFMGENQGIRRLGAAALDLCWVACGRVEGYWEWRLKPWDSAAGQLIVREAGGRVTDFHGKPHSVYGEQTLATNGRIHAEMVRIMRPLLAKQANPSALPQ
jgi:myo-inositol-1(or 4)-monophosphatase